GMAGMNGAGGGWDMPAAGAGGGAGANAGRSPCGGAEPAGGAAPWDQPAASAPDWAGASAMPGRGGASGANAGMNGGGWGADMAPAAPGASDWGAPVGGSAPEWGAPPAAPRPDWNAGPASHPQQDWNAAAVAPQGQQGFEVAGGGYGEADKTRVVRPSGQQSLGMIVVRQGKEPGRIFEVRKDRLTIGRSRESDIFLEDLAVSRLHTTVARDNSGRYLLRDENSANGTYVNGQRISEHVLDEGDEIQVGQTVLAFVRR
ncbi:MAG: FHA domain-containing protein, partial [Ktedonobacterales bacterium]